MALDSFVAVQPDSSGKHIEASAVPEALGGVNYRQIVQFSGAQENVIAELLARILDELRALRFQNSNAMNVAYEPTASLVDLN